MLRASPQVGLAGGLKSWLGFAGSMTGTAALSSGPEKRVDCHDHHDGGGGHGDGGHGDGRESLDHYADEKQYETKVSWQQQ